VAVIGLSSISISIPGSGSSARPSARRSAGFLHRLRTAAAVSTQRSEDSHRDPLSIRAMPFVEAMSGAAGPAEETVTMPQYLLSVWFDEPYDDDIDLSTPENQRQLARTGELTAEMQRAGAWVFVAGLRPASSATVVRATGGEVSMTDGPYAETKEQMGGLWVIEAPDLDAALDWAAKASAACGQPIEVRPTHAP
jgi:hypothetical protein